MDDEEPPFVALSELGCLGLDWPRALFMSMTRYQFELDQMRKGMQRALWLYTVRSLYNMWQAHSAESGQTCRLMPHGVGAAVAVPGDLVYCLEWYTPGLHRSHEESS